MLDLMSGYTISRLEVFRGALKKRLQKILKSNISAVHSNHVIYFYNVTPTSDIFRENREALTALLSHLYWLTSNKVFIYYVIKRDKLNEWNR